MPVSRVLLVLLVSLLAGCPRPHVEYLYAHNIVGTVLDPDGAPVAGAQVARVDNTGAVAGIDSLYVTTTDANGRFELVFRGLGGEPAPADTWYLVARTDAGQARGTLVVPWTCDAQPCAGYAGEIVLRMKR